MITLEFTKIVSNDFDLIDDVVPGMVRMTPLTHRLVLRKPGSKRQVKSSRMGHSIGVILEVRVVGSWMIARRSVIEVVCK